MKYLKTYNESFKLIEIRAKMGEMLQDINDILLDVSDEGVPVNIRDNSTEININIGKTYDSPYSSKMYKLSDIKDTISRLDGYLKSNYDFGINYYIDRAPVDFSNDELVYKYRKDTIVDVNSFSNVSIDIILEEPTQMIMRESAFYKGDDRIENELELRQTLQDIGLELRDEGYHVQTLHTRFEDPKRYCILLRVTSNSYIRTHDKFAIRDIVSVIERMIGFMESEGFYCDFVVNSSRVFKTLDEIRYSFAEAVSIRFFKK